MCGHGTDGEGGDKSDRSDALITAEDLCGRKEKNHQKNATNLMNEKNLRCRNEKKNKDQGSAGGWPRLPKSEYGCAPFRSGQPPER